MSEPSGEWITENGDVHTALANAVSDAIVASGLDTDVAACIVAAVAADYARKDYGDGYLAALANVVLMRSTFEMPTYTPVTEGGLT